MIGFDLTEEQRRYQALVRDFAAKEVVPHVAAYDREERYPAEIVARMGELGLLGGVIPETYGGTGLDYVTFAVGLEEMARVCIHIASAMGRASGLVGSAILEYGTEGQS